MIYTQNNDLLNIKFKTNDIITLAFTGSQKALKLKKGKYLIKCYGAQGGQRVINGSADANGALGGYTEGILELSETTTLYAYIGKMGARGYGATGGVGGWNGGANGGGDSGTSNDDVGGGGGGSSDIRLVNGLWNDIISLRSRIMVAAGGGGSLTNGIGGGLQGGVHANNNQATQTTGFAFGYGQTGGHGGQGHTGKGGGGGGYYGGYSVSTSGATNTGAGGNGGSSFISGLEGCNAINKNGVHTGQPIHYSGLTFTNALTTSGIASGNGYIEITVLEIFSYFINNLDNIQYIENENFVNINQTEDTLTQEHFEEYGMDENEFDNLVINNNVLSLFVSTKSKDIINYKLLNFDQKIINTYKISLGNVTLYKMQIDENLNDSYIKYLFCVNDNWYFLNSDKQWQEIIIEDFDLSVGNTAEEISLFTESNWLNFDELYNKDNVVYDRNIKVAILLSHDKYDKTPIVNNIKVWCYLPAEALSISTNNYDIVESFDKYEIRWINNMVTSLMIYYI